MSEVRWATMALADLKAIDRHYRQVDRALADRMSARIVHAAGVVADVPGGGPIHHGDRRRWLVAGTPYVLFYRIVADHVRILRVRHTARNPLR